MVDSGQLQEAAYDAIQKKILRLELKPGEKISKNALETELKIGATPIREALLRLRREGLLTVVPQSGTYVAKIDLAKVYQARFVRETLEERVIGECEGKLTEASQQDFKKIIDLQEVYLRAQDYDHFFDMDEQFHQLFYRIAEKLFVWNWLQVINLQFNRFRYLRLEVATLDWQQIVTDHRAIVTHLTSHETVLVQQTVHQHLHMVDTDITLARAAHPDYFA